MLSPHWVIRRDRAGFPTWRWGWAGPPCRTSESCLTSICLCSPVPALCPGLPCCSMRTDRASPQSASCKALRHGPPWWNLGTPRGEARPSQRPQPPLTDRACCQDADRQGSLSAVFYLGFLYGHWEGRRVGPRQRGNSGMRGHYPLSWHSSQESLSPCHMPGPVLGGGDLDVSASAVCGLAGVMSDLGRQRAQHQGRASLGGCGVDSKDDGSYQGKGSWAGPTAKRRELRAGGEGAATWPFSRQGVGSEGLRRGISFSP